MFVQCDVANMGDFIAIEASIIAGWWFEPSEKY